MATTTYGVTAAGYRAPRGEELLQVIKDSLDSALGESLTYDADTLEGVLAFVMASVLGDLSEGAVQQLADALDINNAQEQLLENLTMLHGVGRQGASASQVTLTCTLAAPSVFVPAGTRFATDPTTGAPYTVWATAEDTTLTAGAPTLIARCTELGPVAAEAGTVVRVLDNLPNLSAVTNVAAAAPGQAVQKDYELRRAHLNLLQAGGRGTLGSILAAATQAMPTGTFVGAVENTADAAIVLDGKVVAGHGHAVVVYPEPIASDADRLRLAIARTRPASGPTSGDHVGTVFDSERGGDVTLGFYVAEAFAVPVQIDLLVAAGYLTSEAEAAAEAAVARYFAGLQVGDDVLLLQLYRELAAEPAILSADVQLDVGTGFAPANVPVGVFHIATNGGVTFL